MRRLRWASGCFLFIAREEFHQIGGFNESLFASEEIAFSRAIKRRGRFVLLSHPVITSGRKLRTYSGPEILRVIVKLSLRPWLLKRRSELDLWYSQRRVDRRERKVISSLFLRLAAVWPYVGLLVLALAFRLPHLVNARGVHSDAAIVGLQAMHMLEGEFSPFGLD
jgi:GT2 family glycosyltransferase